MVRACYIILLCLLILLPFTYAVDLENSPNPSVDFNSQSKLTYISATDLATVMAKQTEDVISKVNQNNDGNVQALSNDIQKYQKDFQQKALIGILGANLLVAGVVFFILNRLQRNVTYSSIEAKRQKEEGDRISLIGAVNDIRAKVDYLEDNVRRSQNTSVVPAETIMRQDYEEQYGGDQYGQQPSNPLADQDEAWRY